MSKAKSKEAKGRDMFRKGPVMNADSKRYAIEWAQLSSSRRKSYKREYDWLILANSLDAMLMQNHSGCVRDASALSWSAGSMQTSSG